ncbi:hypothetical protein GOP97_18765 [Vibrio cholerae]|nr:hypothetical protein [Vibrio cholerae]
MVLQNLLGASEYNKRLKRDCQRVAFPVPMSCGGYSCCVLVWLLCVASPLGGRYVLFEIIKFRRMKNVRKSAN